MWVSQKKLQVLLRGPVIQNLQRFRTLGKFSLGTAALAKGSLASPCLRNSPQGRLAGWNLTQKFQKHSGFEAITDLWIQSSTVDSESNCGFKVQLWIQSLTVDSESNCGFRVQLWIQSPAVDSQSNPILWMN